MIPFNQNTWIIQESQLHIISGSIFKTSERTICIIYLFFVTMSKRQKRFCFVLFFPGKRASWLFHFKLIKDNAKEHVYVWNYEKAWYHKGDIQQLPLWMISIWICGGYFNHCECFNIILHTIARKQLWFLQDQWSYNFRSHFCHVLSEKYIWKRMGYFKHQREVEIT